ncbi:MAG TPA: histidine kinase, partial [Bacillota bacterium]
MGQIVGWVAHLNRVVPLFYKVLIANAALIAAGALAAAWALTHAHGMPVPGGLAPATVILAGAIGISILVNYLLMRLAFHPLFRLRETMEAVRHGQLSARAPSDAADPDVAELAATFNIMIEELERYRRSASSVILRALEEERKRFARELHDETSQALTNLVIRLEILLDGLDKRNPAQLADDLRYLRDLAANALNETRRLTFDLRPTILDDLGLVPAIRWLIKNKLEPAGLGADFEVSGFEQRLP